MRLFLFFVCIFRKVRYCIGVDSFFDVQSTFCRGVLFRIVFRQITIG